jgi:glycosyltransferase involved in cell wall biosynthesis
VVGGLTTACARAGMSIDVLLVRHEYVRSYGRSFPSWTVSASSGETSRDGKQLVTIFSVPSCDAIDAAMRLVRARQPDIIHIHPVELWPIGKAIKQATGIPIVYTVHSLNLAEYEVGHEPPEILNLWHTQQALIAEADRILALTEEEKALLLHSCPSARDRVRVVGNGIDDSAVARTVASGRTQKQPPLILYTGRFVDRKGIHELLQAIPLVLQVAPETQFVLVGGYGSGSDIAHAWLPTNLYPYRSQLTFTGWLNTIDVGKWYERADVLVVPSWYEPFGMVVLEGMLYGLPVAASHIGGPREILQHGKTGLLFPPKNVEALAGALIELVTNPELCCRLGKTAAKVVREHWLWPRIVEKIEGIYQQVR